MPHLEIVAGVLFDKSSASRITVINPVNLMHSPVYRVNFLLSSSTELRFSTHSESIGPSNTIQLRLSEVSLAHILIACAMMPSFQS